MSLATLHITSPDGGTVAELVPEAGMLCCSLVHRGEQLLDSGRGLEAYASAGHTMGIPLLYPWANRLAAHDYSAAGKSVRLADDPARISTDPNGLPIHGAVPALMRWLPEDRGDGDQSALTARLQWSSPKLLELFPFAHEVGLEIAAGPNELTIATTVIAGGSDSVPVSFGYHPYLRLPEGGRERWRVQLPGLERLALDSRMIPTGKRTPASETDFDLADSSWDDGFAVLAQPARFAVTAPSGRGIALELLEGYPFAQIYAPPGKDFICFEPMTAPTNALRSGDALPVLAPGDEYRATFRVTAFS